MENNKNNAMLINRKYFSNKKGGFFIEAGSHDGIHRSVGWWFEKEKDWTGLNIEPNPTLYAKLLKNRPHCMNVNFALDQDNGVLKKLVWPTGISGWGTINKKRKEKVVKQRFDESLVITANYNQLLTFLNIDSVDLMVVDIEGHEDNFLQSLDANSVLPKVFMIENSHEPQYYLRVLQDLGYSLDHHNEHDSFLVREDA